jgi:hypothetical protein
MAKNNTFDEWVTFCFSDSQEISHISNAQTAMLGGVYRYASLRRKSTDCLEFDVYQAVRNLQNVRFLARTEYFDDDVSRFPDLFSEYGIKFMYKKIKPLNITSDNHASSVEERIEELEKELSSKNVKKLWNANAQDIMLFGYVEKSIGNN